jgi:hypothetical protein
MASKPGRKLGYYRDGPGYTIKCVLNLLIKQKRDRKWVLEQFKKLVPDYNSLLMRPVTDDGLWGRADIGVRPGRYETEHPDKEPAALVYMPAAKAIVAAGRRVTPTQFLAAVKRSEEPKAAPAAKRKTVVKRANSAKRKLKPASNGSKPPAPAPEEARV